MDVPPLEALYNELSCLAYTVHRCLGNTNRYSYLVFTYGTLKGNLMIQEFDMEIFSKTFQSLANEYAIEPTGKDISNVVIHLPRSWEDDKEYIDIKGVEHFYSTEDTLEIEVRWKEPYRALVMQAPWI